MALMELSWKSQSIIFAVFTAASLSAFSAEQNAFEQTHQQTTDSQRLASPIPVTIGFSLKSVSDGLMACSDAMFGPVARLQSKQSRTQISMQCETLAHKALANSPTNGFAYFVAAQAAQISGRNALRDEYLAESVKFAPAEGWLAERRFVLSLSFTGPDKMLINNALSSDISTMLTYQAGAEMLAKYALLRPVAKELIEPIVGMAGRGNQIRFANLIAKLRATI